LRIEELKVSGVPPEAEQVSGKKNEKTETLIIVISNFYQLLATDYWLLDSSFSDL
jgi:hypothetical protein